MMVRGGTGGTRDEHHNPSITIQGGAMRSEAVESEAVESETISVCVGIDVSKNTLDVAFICRASGEVRARDQVSNTTAGHGRLVEHARAYDVERVVMEATGTYHLHVAKAIRTAGLPLSIVNPLQVKRFAQLKQRRAKTDRADAALLAAYGREEEPEESEPPRPAQAKLKQIATLIDQLTRQRTALKNQQQAEETRPDRARVCHEVLTDQIQTLTRNIDQLKEEQERIAHEAFAEAKALAESVIGVGPRITCALLAYAGDLSGFTSHKQLTAFMGLDPRVHQSGTSKGPRGITKRGHRRLRTLFYMGAHSARVYNRACKALYQRLRARGKAKKVALIAVANKLVKQVFAVIKSQTVFDNDRYSYTNQHTNASVT